MLVPNETSSPPGRTAPALKVALIKTIKTITIFNFLILILLLAFYKSADLANEEEAKTGTLVIALTSDRGLCGAVHSNVAKRIRAIMKEDPNASNLKIICIGDKAKLMLAK